MFPLSYEKIIVVAYTNITRTFNLTILQALWEPYFWMFSEGTETIQKRKKVTLAMY